MQPITMSNDHSDRLCFFVVELYIPNYAANQHNLHPNVPVLNPDCDCIKVTLQSQH